MSAEPVIWCVWKDLFNEEVLAVEADEMTDPLRVQLERERTKVVKVHAHDRHAAVREAFPDDFSEVKTPNPKVRVRRHRLN